MKKIIMFMLLCMLLFDFGGLAESDIKLYLNDKIITCDVPPVIVNNRTLVPARALFEPLGASLEWYDEKKQAEINLDDKQILLCINSNTAYVNNNPYVLDSPPLIINNRTMLPVRFVAENLGYDVNWDAGLRAVHISEPTPAPTPTPAPPSNSIKDISSSESGGYLSIAIKFTRPLDSYDLYPMNNPERMVLELNDCVYSKTNTINIGYGGVQKIRMGNHTELFKLVVDLDKYLPYEFNLSDDKTSATLKFTLSIESSKEIDTNTVVIDAGHGGSDSGAQGYKDGEVIIKEKDINLDIALKVASILKEKGVNVLLTRSTDVAMPLGGRYTFANDSNAGLFVSIHSNSFSDINICGSLTLYSADKDSAYPKYKSSKEIAQTIQSKLVSSLGTTDRGIRSEDELAVLMHTEIPAVLVEVIFVTSPSDQELILQKENRTKAARGIADGILTAIGK